jgi:hypothetical protein
MANMNFAEKSDTLPLNRTWADEYNDQYRLDLIKMVQTGELTPEKAEKSVAAIEEKPFQNIPPSYDSIDAIPLVWTPEMAAIWFHTRNARAVHRHYLPSFQGRFVWVANGNLFPPRKKRYPAEQPAPGIKQRKGHDLVALEKTSLFDPFVDFDGRPKASFPPERIWLEPIRLRLQSGSATAFGFPVNDGALTKPIPTAIWGDATFIKEQSSGETVLARGMQIEFRRVTFNAKETIASLQYPLLKWKDQPDQITPLATRVVNSLKNHWPFGLPLKSLKAKELAILIEFIPPEEKPRWEGRPTEFHRFLKPVLGQVCEVPLNADTTSGAAGEVHAESSS